MTAELISKAKSLVRQFGSASYQNGVVDERDTSFKQQKKYSDMSKDLQAQLFDILDQLEH